MKSKKKNNTAIVALEDNNLKKTNQMQDIQISIGQQFYSKDYDETLQVHSIREQPDPKIYLSGTTSDREVTLYKSDIVRLLNEKRLKEVNTPKKSLNTDILNSFIGDLAWGNDTEMNRLKQVYLSFSPQEREFVEKNAVREGANSIEEVFEKVLSKDEKEKLENKINNFLNTVKQMETTEQKEVNQKPTIDLQIGQKLHYKEDVFEVTRFAKDKNGQDMVILKDPSIGTGVEIPWYRSKLEEIIESGQYKITSVNSTIENKINNSFNTVEQMETTEQEVSSKATNEQKSKENLQTILDFLDKNQDKGISFYKEKVGFDESIGAEWIAETIPEKEILLVKDYNETMVNVLLDKNIVEKREGYEGNVVEETSQKIFYTNFLNTILKDKNYKESFLTSEDGQPFAERINEIAEKIKANQVRETTKQEITQNSPIEKAKWEQEIATKAAIEEKLKVMPKEYYPLVKAYALSEDQQFDNYNADWGNTESDKIEAYKALKQNFPEEIVKSVEKIVDDNTYTQNKEANKVYVANIVGILDNIEQQQQVHSSPQLSQQQFTQLNYLKNQVKYLGLGEDTKLHKDLENAILSPEDKVTVRAEYNYPDRLMKGNTATFDLNLTKTEQGGVFLNSYRANLTTKNGEERSQTFKVQKENSVTAKEAINLLEGRSVKIEHDVVDKKTGELSRTESFIKLNMKEPKTDYGNYKYEWYNKNAYGVDIDNIMQKSNLTFANDIERERTKKHLEKGNITQVTFQQENRQIQGFAVLNPQWKMLNLYDSAMNRVTIQNQLVKPEVTQSQQKNNVPEHSISR